nr:uncharacterized protein LOC111502712 [Leptinotarsa decemlineata]
MFLQVLVICVLYIHSTNQVVIPPTVSGNSSRNITHEHLTPLVPLFHYGNRSYYMGVHMKVTFLQAKQFCENIDMKLVSIESAEENDRMFKEIRELNKGDEYWSSGSRMVDGKEWRWMSTGKRFEFSKWATGQPDSPVDQCTVLTHQKNVGLFWNDRDCNLLFWFICEKEFDAGNNYTELRVTGSLNPIQMTPLWPNIKLLHFKNKSYYFSRQFKGNFLQAVEFCQMINMQLVTITSEEENSRIHKYIRDTIGGDSWWTSGSRILDGERWVWISTGKQVEYTNWLVGQPDNMNDLCINLIHQRNNGLFWNDINCNTAMQVICEAPNADYNYEEERRNKKGTYYDNYWGGRDWRPLVDVRDDSGDSEWLRRVRRVPPGAIHMSHQEGKTFHVENDLEGTQAEAVEFCNYHNMQLLEVDDKKVDIIKRLLSDSSVVRKYWTANPFPKSRSCIVIDKYVTGRIQFCESKRNFICEIGESSRFSPYPQPVVNVYVSNNVMKEDGTMKKISENFFLSNNISVTEEGYQVEFNTSFEVPVEADDNENTSSIPLLFPHDN